MDKPKRDEKRGLIARNYRPVEEPRERPRVWCADEAAKEILDRPKRQRK